jgi:flagellar basal-body rod protein FlgB
MAIGIEKALGMREQALRLRSERANVLSSNLANADTPNYKARDIDFRAEMQARMGKADAAMVRTTNARHMSISGDDQVGFTKLYRTPGQPSIDGNTVEEHVEHAEFMKNSLEFQVAFTMLNSSIKGLTKAFRGE